MHLFLDGVSQEEQGVGNVSHVYLLGDTLVISYANYQEELFTLTFLANGLQDIRLLAFDVHNLSEPNDWTILKGSLSIEDPLLLIREEGCRLKNLEESYSGIDNSPGPFLMPAILEAEIFFDAWSERYQNTLQVHLIIEYISKTRLGIITEC